MADLPEKSVAASASEREEAILAFWKRERIFEKSLAKKSPKGDFIFYEGPPTANGKPGIHHLEARAFKDAIPRYKTMRGYRVHRRAGWDTHGLPVELQVEKDLGFSGKRDIERYGIAAFNKKSRESVFTYIDLWAKFTKRIGYWVDETKAYFTFDSSYMEVLWHLFAKIAKDGRLYRDYKVVPWCPRCGTALSSHELAQGYADVKDLAVTAKFELVDEPGTFLLAWTTTPWTLPGNVALAVGNDIEYGVYEHEGKRVILAKELASRRLEEQAVATLHGRDLVGKKYKPLYDFAKSLAPESEKPKFDKAFQVYAADFVTTEDGTGIVHTAVMYGQDDFELGNARGLPKVHLVSPEGTFVSGTGFLEGKSVVDEEVAIDIVKDLAARNMLFLKEKHEHSYPFCWRCKTRLIYYARDSWYIRMSDLRGTLVAENKKIHWEPKYIRDGRMGEWLAGAKDWAISRERYWGTPLPVWRSEDGSEQVVIGSVDELKKRTKKSGNTYFVMRHGEAGNITHKMFDGADARKFGLSEKGREEVRAAAKKLIGRRISHVYVSPFTRTRETAEIVTDVLGIPRENVIVDERLRELNMGVFDGTSDIKAFYAYRDRQGYADPFPGGESYQNAKNRFGEALYDLERTYRDTTILMVTHGIGLETLQAAAQGASAEESRRISMMRPHTAEIEEVSFIPLPHNEDYELDLHRPYIDEVVLVSDKGTELRRVKEVMDVWFDSGAMPFAQAAKERGDESLETFLRRVEYPADFISEAIDQTRGWFYTLLAVGVLAGRGAAFRNAISLGHLLDAEGQKMSKSKGNVVDPWVEIEKWGADTLRFWMYSVTQPGDSKNYDEKTVKEAAKTLSWFEHSAKFYELFKESVKGKRRDTVLERWMRERTTETVEKITTALDDYKLFEATRALGDLFGDLSQWYVRRIRDRARDGDAAAVETLRETLFICARLLAPFAPFLAEEVYKKVKKETDPVSVHLADWPSPRGRAPFKWMYGVHQNMNVLPMRQARLAVEHILMARNMRGLKVRQPLSEVALNADFHFRSEPEFIDIIKQETNIKEVNFYNDINVIRKLKNNPDWYVVDDFGTLQLAINTKLTPELIKEGDEREMARAVAEARKAEGLSPQDAAHADVRPEGKYAVALSTGPVRFDLVSDAS